MSTATTQEFAEALNKMTPGEKRLLAAVMDRLLDGTVAVPDLNAATARIRSGEPGLDVLFQLAYVG